MRKTEEYVKNKGTTMFFPKVFITREEAESLHRYGQIMPSWLKLVVINYDEYTDIWDAKRPMTAADGYQELVDAWTGRADEVLENVRAFADGGMDLIDMVFTYYVGYKQCRKFSKDVLTTAGIDADVDDYWKQHKKHAQKDTTVALYGVTHTAMRPEVQGKRRATNQERYGADNPMQNPEIKEKLRKRIREERGVDYTFQLTTVVPWQKKLYDTLTEDAAWEDVLDRFAAEHGEEEFTPEMFGTLLPVTRRDFVISELDNTHVEDLIRLWNEKTGFIMSYPDNRLFSLPFAFSKTWLKHYDRLGVLKVPELYYSVHGSIYEKRVEDLLERLGVKYVKNGKKMLDGLEMDFYIPEKKIGIEVNPNVSHNSNLYATEAVRSMFDSYKEPSYHYDKYKRAQAAGVTLIQLFGNDLEPSVFESVTAKRLKVLLMGAAYKFPARKTKVYRLITDRQKKRARSFLDMYHSQGSSRASEYWAFECGGEWRGVASFAEGRNGVELKRLCFAPDTQVVGGLSKLIKHYFREHPECGLVYSYSDNNLGPGTAYERAGARFVRETGPSLKFISPKDGRDCYSWQIATEWGATGGVIGNDADERGIEKPQTKEEINLYVETELSHRYDDGRGYDRIYTAGSKLWHFTR